MGDRLPGRVARSYRRFRHGPGAFKVDFAIEGDVPWAATAARDAGTVHLGGSADEVFANEKTVHHGRDARATVRARRPAVPGRPQQVGRQRESTLDLRARAARIRGRRHRGDHLADRTFCTGFRDQIVGTAVRSATEMSVYNPNYVGGDIIGGASSLKQLLFRPRFALDPYFTGVPGTYLCSASTPPGAGAHGMCGSNAAPRALRELGIESTTDTTARNEIDR